MSRSAWRRCASVTASSSCLRRERALPQPRYLLQHHCPNLGRRLVAATEDHHCVERDALR